MSYKRVRLVTTLLSRREDEQMSSYLGKLIKCVSENYSCRMAEGSVYI